MGLGGKEGHENKRGCVDAREDPASQGPGPEDLVLTWDLSFPHRRLSARLFVGPQ